MKGTILTAIMLGLILFNLAFVSQPVSAVREVWNIYHTSDEVNTILKDLAADYPALMTYEVIGKSILGADIYMFKVGNPNGGQFMFDGKLHGAEDCGTELGIEFIKWVLTSTESDAKRVRERNYLLFIPLINTDTHERPNMRRSYTYPNGSTIKIAYGVDLNRNFPTGWGSSGTGDPNDNYDYRGPAAGSEPETKAVLNAMKKYTPDIYANVHCGMQTLGYDQKTATATKVLALITNISARKGVNTNGYYSPGGGGGGGGMASNEGAVYSGGNGWLFETTEWNNMPDTLSGFLSTWYPRAFPVYLAMAQAVEKIPTTSSFCGDGTCNSNESCNTCSRDCGNCTSVNHAPTHSTPLLRASDSPLNTTNANLTCYNQSTADADGDRVRNIYRWYRDSTLMTAFTNRTVITASNTEVGQRWMCQVTPYDGKDYGITRNSSVLLIRAAAATYFCGDGTCNSNESCNTCSRDCGNCTPTSTIITGCRIENKTWNEDETLTNAYDLSDCFNDPLHHNLSFISAEKKVVTVSITKEGLVTLSAPPDWSGTDYVSFRANDGDRIAWTNKALLTVNPMPECGDAVCDDGESCDSCEADCGECERSGGGGGGGGGGGSLSDYYDLVTNDAIVAEPEVVEPEVTEPVIVEPEKIVVSLEDVGLNSHSDSGANSGFIIGEVESAQMTGEVAAVVGVEQPNELEPLPVEQRTPESITSSSGGLTHSPALLVLIIAFLSLGVFGAYLNFNEDLNEKIRISIFKQPRVFNHVSELEWHHLAALNDYVTQALKLNYSKEKIEFALLSVGWSFEVVESLLQSYFSKEPAFSTPGIQTALEDYSGFQPN